MSNGLVREEGKSGQRPLSKNDATASDLNNHADERACVRMLYGLNDESERKNMVYIWLSTA